MKQVYQRMSEILSEGQPIMLVKVVDSSGSTPGGKGATMIVSAAGRQAGTIGGGAVEHFAEVLGVQLLAEKRSTSKDYILRHSDAGDIGMVCGGDVTVYFCYLPATPQAVAFAKNAAAAFDKQENTWLLMQLKEGGCCIALYTRDAGLNVFSGSDDCVLRALPSEKLAALLPVLTEIDGIRYYCEPLVRAGRAVVFGGGHVAQALVPVLSSIGFRTVVYDDRPEFANARLFPTADEIIVAGFSNVYDNITLTDDDWLVIVTRGHAADFEVQKQVLLHPFAYVGVIGSRAKIHSVNKRLRDAGIPKESIDAVYTPIGLDIGAETPAEIAISIAGEMIQLRAALNKQAK